MDSSTGQVKQPVVFSGARVNGDEKDFYKLVYAQLKLLEEHAPNSGGNSKAIADLVGKLKTEVVNNVYDYISFFERQMEEVDFDYAFDITKPLSIKLTDIFSKAKLEEHLYEGILQLEDIGLESNSRINQTLFFFPIIGGLYDLNEELYQEKIKAN